MNADLFDWLPQSLRWEALALYAGRTETGATSDLLAAFAEVATRHGLTPPPSERERLLAEIAGAEERRERADRDLAHDDARRDRVLALIDARLARLRTAVA